MTSTAPAAPLVVVCGLDHANVAEEQDVLGKAGVRLQAVLARTEAEYLERCGEADALLIQYGAITRRVLEGLPRVRVLVRYGVGVDGIDLAAATDHGRAGRERAGLRDGRGREPCGGAAPVAGPQDRPARPPDTERRLGRVPRSVP